MGLKPVAVIKTSEGERALELPSDNTFAKPTDDFAGCIISSDKKNTKYAEILEQSGLIDAYERN